ncbi:MAG: hypothetical protein P8Y66_07640 [Nitrospirota bacterium]|jgi:hypothetical protein
MDIVNEKSSWFVTVSFLDEEGAPVAPDSGSYRIDDAGSGAEITADTAFVPSGTSHVIEITPGENSIVGAAEADTRLLTVTFAYSGGRQGTAEYAYLVKNLSKVS